MIRSAILILVCVGALLSSACGISSVYPSDPGTLALIASDIEGLKKTYPQLKEFSSQENLDVKSLKISYAYRTHKAKPTGGWTSGVPNPDEDGIWFYIDFHNPSSVSEVHTQPMTTIIPQCLGEKVLSFLILEGSKTVSVNGAIWEILRKYGVAECRHSR